MLYRGKNAADNAISPRLAMSIDFNGVLGARGVATEL